MDCFFLILELDSTIFIHFYQTKYSGPWYSSKILPLCWTKKKAISFSLSNRLTHSFPHILFSSLPWHSREQALSGESPGIMAPIHSALPFSHTLVRYHLCKPQSPCPLCSSIMPGNRGLKGANGGIRPERTGQTPVPNMSIWTKHATFNKPNKQKLNTKA